MPITLLAKDLVTKTKITEVPGISKKAQAATKKLDKAPTDKASLKIVAESKTKIASIEKAAATVVAAFNTKNTQNMEALAALAKSKPLPPPTAAGIKKYGTIAKSSRKAELADLIKSAKRGELHTNPTKLTRILGDLNSDATAINTLETDLPGEIDKVFGAEVDALKPKLLASGPKGLASRQHPD